jgi:aconitase A
MAPEFSADTSIFLHDQHHRPFFLAEGESSGKVQLATEIGGKSEVKALQATVPVNQLVA